MKEIIEHQKLSSIVENVETASCEIAQAFALFNSAKDRLKATIGDDHILPHELRDYRLHSATTDSLLYVRRNAWTYIFSQLQLRNYLSSGRKRNLDEQIEKNQLPDLTMENVLATIEALRLNLGGLLDEAIKETFDFLRPERTKHKTNLHYSVGERVIITGVLREYGGLCSHREQQIRSLDTVMHMLDGQGAPKYPDDLATQLHEAVRDKADKLTTKYFECRWYEKALTIHVRFLRPDLLRELNRIGAGESGQLGDKEKRK